MKKFRLTRYSDNYKDELAPIVNDFFKEAYNTDYIGNIDKAKATIDVVLNNGYTIYLVLVDEVLTSFMVVGINKGYGMHTPFIECDYMYIAPEYRGSIVTKLIHSKLIEISYKLKIDCRMTTFITSADSNAKRLGGKPVANSYIFDRRTIRKLNYMYNRKGAND